MAHRIVIASSEPYLRTNLPGRFHTDDRPGAPSTHLWWAGNQGEVGIFGKSGSPRRCLRAPSIRLWKCISIRASLEPLPKP